MNFKASNENPLIELVELRTNLLPKGEDNSSYGFFVEFGVNPDEIEDKIGTILVEITEVTLALELYGLEVLPATKFGISEPAGTIKRSYEAENKNTSSREVGASKSAAFSGKASLTDLGASLSAETRGNEKVTETISFSTKETISECYSPIKVMTGDRWKVRSKDGQPLDGSYLNHDTLCEVRFLKGTNRVGAETRAVVKQKHINVKLDREPSFLSLRSLKTVNQQKIMKALLAKTLHEKSSDEKFSGQVVFSRSQVFDEG